MTVRYHPEFAQDVLRFAVAIAKQQASCINAADAVVRCLEFALVTRHFPHLQKLFFSLQEPGRFFRRKNLAAGLAHDLLARKIPKRLAGAIDQHIAAVVGAFRASVSGRLSCGS